MAEEAKPEKKKVYVETTVISDATALPTNDLSVAGRQITTRTWWATAATRFSLYSSDIVKREAMRGDSDAAMIVQQEDTLEEMWRIKREIAEEYPTWEEYVAGIYAFQEEERRSGVKFATLRPLEPSFTQP